MRIFALARGDRRRIIALPADPARYDALRRLGLVRGATVEVIFAAHYGMAVSVSGVRLALSRRAGEGVEVSEHAAVDPVRQSQFGQEYAV